LTEALFILLLVLCALVAASDPGKLKNDENKSFLQILNKIEPTSICPDCRLIRTPRSRHCAFCEACIDRFDHHCPWVNNCIGKRNFALFYLFVFLQQVYLFLAGVQIIFAIKLEFWSDKNEGTNWQGITVKIA